MNYTENYRLNQWDAEDRILREDFNRDNANVESGLTALKKGLETETQERKTAVTAAKQEASQALTSAVGALESGKADKTALAQLQAQVDGMPFVKLQEITVSQGGVNQIDVDVSQIQWQQYAYVLFRVKLLMEDGGLIRLLVNGQTDYVYESGNRSQQYLQRFRGTSLSGVGFQSVQIQFMEERGYMTTLQTGVDGNSGSGEVVGGILDPLKISALQVQTLNFVAESERTLAQNGKIYIYGVKL